MAGRIHKLLASDHARLNGLLNRALAKPDTVDYGPYGEFRAGLLKHIATTPTRTILATVRKILVTHNGLEEDPGGVYEVCEALVGDEIVDIGRRLEAMPEVSLARHVDGSQVMEAMRRALSRAGHEPAAPE